MEDLNKKLRIIKLWWRYNIILRWSKSSYNMEVLLMEQQKNIEKYTIEHF
jgi:uncharacterized protein (UPF0303 family)